MEIVGADAPKADQIAKRHDRLLRRLRDVAESNGHDPERLRVVAVTKGWPVEMAQAAIAAGLGMLGESRVQEAEPKIAVLPGVEWHFIGRLQSNKARRAVRGFHVIHSVDSLELLDRLRQMAEEEGRSPRLLIQINVSGEAAKAGLTPDAVRAAADGCKEAAGIVGLMTMAPMGVDPGQARAIFRALREIRDELEQALGSPLPELSMGMTADAEAAAAEGATLVRVGTGLFGPRP
ncbi:MAG: YggS family pyridoxal phosphate-dependent enzyme [Candidatus Limnocylindria bacterium]